MTIPSPALELSLGELSAALDAADHTEREAWLRRLSRAELKAMYALAEDGEVLDIKHFYGAPGELVIHHGQNSLPAFNRFQKRVTDNDGIIQGYNHQAMSWLTGPGHFTIRPDGPEVIFDYIIEPAQSAPGFPPLKSNTSGLSTFVYGHMNDRVRRISKHTVIGQAIKKGKPMSTWFALLKEGN
jgi:hypothetical protein